MRKTLLSILALVFIANFSFAQDLEKAKEKATKYIETNFPGAEDIEIDLDYPEDLEGEDAEKLCLIAMFFHEEKFMGALFDTDGNWKRTEASLLEEQTPAVCIAAAKKSKPSFEIEGILYVHDKSDKYYEFEMVADDEDAWLVRVDLNGKVIKKNKLY